MIVSENAARWAGRMLLRIRPEGRLSRVVVRHAGSAGARAASVAELDVDPNEAAAESLAKAIVKACEDDAAGLGGMMQRYVVVAYFGNSAEPGPDRLTLRVHNDDEAGPAPGGFDSEGPTTPGVVTQLMRHNEVLMRSLVGALPQMTQHYQAMLGSAYDRIAKLESREAKNQELHEELSEKKAERDLRIREQERIESRDKVILQKLESVFPVVLNRITGQQQGVPQLPAARPIDAMFLQLFESIDDETFSKVLALLEPEQQILALELFKQLKFQGGGSPPTHHAATINGSGGRPS